MVIIKLLCNFLILTDSFNSRPLNYDAKVFDIYQRYKPTIEIDILIGSEAIDNRFSI